MHSKNIIHRDIKLENMMLGEVNDLRSVKIADFGFAIEIHTDEDRSKVRRGDLACVFYPCHVETGSQHALQENPSRE